MKQVFGSILLAVGILIAGCSGLCSLVFSMDTLFGSSNHIRIDLPIIFIVGGIPFGIGLALFFGGRALIRQAKLEAETTQPQPSHKSEKTPTIDGPSPQ
jgi:sensor domain CHASE-containing protein